MSRLDNLTKEVEALKKENALLRHSPIAFLAELTKTVSGQNHQIHFDQVKVNIGNAYYPSHGNFIASVNGLYQFSITACSTANHYVVLELTVNTSVVGKVLADDTGYDECSSKTFLIQLSSGDDVFVQHKSQGDYLLSASAYGFPSFSGVLLRAL
ncbi:C1QL [Mytilus coruscus]|uniref:C1QL n=1 Tax=Mytilus coruscus TaxID=42192 RepID=A0A6J8E4C9_MYTCO|nr:C1QL [Mytilus coruscus]